MLDEIDKRLDSEVKRQANKRQIYYTHLQSKPEKEEEAKEMQVPSF